MAQFGPGARVVALAFVVLGAVVVGLRSGGGVVPIVAVSVIAVLVAQRRLLASIPGGERAPLRRALPSTWKVQPPTPRRSSPPAGRPISSCSATASRSTTCIASARTSPSTCRSCTATRARVTPVWPPSAPALAPAGLGEACCCAGNTKIFLYFPWSWPLYRSV